MYSGLDQDYVFRPRPGLCIQAQTRTMNSGLDQDYEFRPRSGLCIQAQIRTMNSGLDQDYVITMYSGPYQVFCSRPEKYIKFPSQSYAQVCKTILYMLALHLQLYNMGPIVPGKGCLHPCTYTQPGIFSILNLVQTLFIVSSENFAQNVRAPTQKLFVRLIIMKPF